MLPQTPAITRRLLIQDLILDCRIGVYPQERAAAQRVRLNFDLDVAGERDPSDEDLSKVVDYDQLIGRIRTLVTSRHFGLVEVLAERLAELCLEDARVRRARVRVDKLQAISDAAAVGIEVERQNARPLPRPGGHA